ncbi:MAG: RidA family protein [Planctomycetes bacterium]|nr:RidA family protein [Planctomycetota bacterium]
MNLEYIQPKDWQKPSGYANGVLVKGAGRLLFVAGQVAWDRDQRIVGKGNFALQFEQALKNVMEIVTAAGGKPEHVVRLTVYVTDKQLYLARTKEIGAAWRELMGRTYPAMALVQVAGLIEEGALVEIEATAAMP